VKTYVSWITPTFPEIAASRRVTVQSNSAEHAALLVQRTYPGHDHTLPREEAPDGYVQDFLDSERARLLDRAPAMEKVHV
jgi:hypothetical protein